MADEVVGSARIRIEPDTSGFEDALLADLTTALSDADDAITQAFQRAAQTASDSLATIGEGGFPDAAGAASEAADQIQSAFAGTGDAITSEVDGVGAAIATEVESGADAASAALDGIGTGAGDAIIGEFSGTGDAIASDLQTGVSQATGGFDALESAGSGAAEGIIQSFEGLQGVIAGIAATVGVTASLSAAERVQSVAAVTNQLIETTGGVANVTAQEVLGLGDALERTTNFESEVTQEAENMLLTFKGVRNEVGAGNDIFNRAVVAAGDLATVLGSDMRGATLQLGKALQDPTRGVNALRRAGVDFTVEQRELIKSLVAENDLLGAQKIVLGEVESQVGGTAAAAVTASDRIKNSLGNIVEAFGAGLLSPTDEFADRLPALVDEIAPTVERLGESVGNIIELVLDSAVALAPALGGTLRLVEAGLPILDALVDLLDAIPDPVLQAAAAYVIFSKAGGAFGPTITNLRTVLQITQAVAASRGISTAGAGMEALKGSVAGAASSFNPLLIGVAAAAVGFTIWNNQQAEARQRAKEVDDAIDGLSDGFDEVGTSVEDSGTAIERWLTDLIKSEGHIQLTNKFLDELASQVDIGDVFTALGLNAKSAADLIAGGVPAINDFADGLGDLSDQQKFAIGLLKEQATQTQAAAKAQLSARLATGELSGAQAGMIEGLLRANDENTDYIAVLDQVAAAERERAEQDAATLTRYQQLADGTSTYVDALQLLDDAGDTIVSRFTSLVSEGGNIKREFVDFALAADAAGLSEEQLAATADILGISQDELKTKIEGVTQSLEDFVSQGLQGLPTVADAFGEGLEAVQSAAEASAQTVRDAADLRAEAILDAAGDDDVARQAAQDQADALREGADEQAQAIVDGAELTAQALIDSLNANAQRIADFNADLQTIFEGGFTEVAATLAQQGVDAAAGVADEVARELEAGGSVMADGLAAGIKNLDSATSDIESFFRSVLGPEVISESLILGALGAQGFAEGLDLAEVIRLTSDETLQALDEGGRSIALLAATKGTDAARALGDAMHLDQEVIDEAIAAGLALTEDDSIPAAATGIGEVANQNLALGWAANRPVRQEEMITSATELLAGVGAGVSPVAFFVGTGLGGDVASGFIAGLLQNQTAAEDKAAQLVLAAEQAARKVAESDSPSKLFARLGADLTAGMAIGMTDTESDVVAAATAIVQNAAAAVAATTPSEFDLRASTGLSGTAAAAGGSTLVLDRPTLDGSTTRTEVPVNAAPLFETLEINEVKDPEATAEAVVRRLKQERDNLGT